MAEIDKGLPNTRTEIKVPSEEELQQVDVQEPEEQKGPVEVIPEEDALQRIADAGGIANLAGGGIAKEAGDPSGAMLESMNPDSQGLPGLLKRVRNR